MKNKTLALASMEIAIVLCSVFLVAFPAAVSAGFALPLPIYGNANGDDTIDMGDVTYIKLIILGKKSNTEFADANHDGKTTMLDVAQTKLILLGREKTLTFIDAKGQLITVQKPLKRIVLPAFAVAEAMRAMDALDPDRIVGVSESALKQKIYLPELQSKTMVVTGSMGGQWDYEAVLNQRPDAVMTSWGPWKINHSEKLPTIPVIYLGVGYGFGADQPEVFTKWIKVLGYLMDRPEEAEILYQWYCEETDNLRSRTEGLSEDEKPRVLTFDHYAPGGKYWVRIIRFQNMSLWAGARNMAQGLKGELDPEWIMDENPDVILADVFVPPKMGGTSGGAAYESDDPTELIAVRDDILYDRLELSRTPAVTNERVYVFVQGNCNILGGGALPVGTAYMGTWFQSVLFADVEPLAIHQDFQDRFHEDLNYNVYEHGVFVYPKEKV